MRAKLSRSVILREIGSEAQISSSHDDKPKEPSMNKSKERRVLSHTGCVMCRFPVDASSQATTRVQVASDSSTPPRCLMGAET